MKAGWHRVELVTVRSRVAVVRGHRKRLSTLWKAQCKTCGWWEVSPDFEDLRMVATAHSQRWGQWQVLDGGRDG